MIKTIKKTIRKTILIFFFLFGAMFWWIIIPAGMLVSWILNERQHFTIRDYTNLHFDSVVDAYFEDILENNKSDE